jgi:hypothetical protein
VTFKPGQSGNPSGRPKVSNAEHRLRRMTKDEIKEVGTLLLDSNVEKLKEIEKDKHAPALRVWICSVAIKAIERGDMGALNSLLDRVIGKVKDELEVSLPKPTIIQLSGDKQIVLGSEVKNEED